EKIESQGDLTAPISSRMAADLQYEAISEWMPFYRDQAETSIKIYNETFSEYSEISEKMSSGLDKMKRVMEEIERNYSAWILRYLMVIDKGAGLTIFSKSFGDLEMDTDLVSGFLTAIQSFGMEVSRKETSMRKLSYQDFEIEIEEGDYIRAALVLQGKVTKYLVRNLFDFVKRFENEFENALNPFTGNITVFQRADDFSEDILLRGLDLGTCEVGSKPLFIPLDDEATELESSEEINVKEEIEDNSLVEERMIPSLGPICPECGMPLQINETKCPRCGKEL
ncbi:MAG: zinc ribbon domain-containing protein, partial [Candidatus Helarchaeales archaeon]